MAQPTNRQEFEHYILRKLGGGVSEINVTEEQLSDRIDEALQLYFEEHYDGTLETFLVHSITDQNVEDGYIPVTDDVISIIRVLPLNQVNGVFDRGIFDLKYQLHLSDLYSRNGTHRGGNLQYFDMQRSHLRLIEHMFTPEVSIRFNRRTNRVYLNENLYDLQTTEGIVVFHAYIKTDPVQFAEVYRDRWLQEYAAALVGQQWGVNLTKFDGIQMLGGVTLNGQAILDRYTQRRQELEQELRDVHSLPLEGFLG